MLIRKGIPVLLVAFVLGIELSAQESPSYFWGHYTFFQEMTQQDTARRNELYVRFNNANFFKNNEYKNNYVQGRSMIGLFFEPSLDFYTASNTMIRTGIHAMKFHGAPEFDRLKPIITLQHQVNPRFSILFGTLYSTTNHGLLEPILSFEKYLTDHYENGMQFLFSYPDFQADFWLNWEQFIHAGDPFQEHFTAGGHMLFRLLKSEKWALNADMQMLFRHKGGEIDSSPLPAGTQSNISQGLTVTYNFNKRFFRSFYLEHYMLGFFEINPGGHITIPDGYTRYSLVGLNTGIGQFQAGYWSGQNYFAPHGDQLFQSDSDYLDDFYTKERKLLTIKYQLSGSLTDYLKVGFRFEPYYHFDTRRMDTSWSIYLLLDKDFLLKEFKK